MTGLSYEPAVLSHAYDLVYITHNGDVAGWTERKRRDGDALKFIFELVDSYFEQRNPVRRLLKGSARYLLGMDSRLSPDFLETLKQACKAADAVLCSTEEQREVIRRYNRNVFLSFDYFADELGDPPKSYGRGEKLRLVWEGQSTTLPNVRAITDPLNDLRDHIELHIVTDPLIYRYFGRFSPFPAMRVLRGIECAKTLHAWDRQTFARRITECDVAIIPIDRGNRFAWGKPENKLVLLWQLGMPVLTSATPVYQRTMAAAGLDLTCADPHEWGEKLEAMVRASPAELERLGRTGRAYAERAYSKDEFARRFGAAFAAIGFTPVR